MRRARLRRLRVCGANKPAAEIAFHPTLTFITGVSNTGKSHILNCVDFALGGSTPQHEFEEARGYDRVFLELQSGDAVVTVRRTFGDDDSAEWFGGRIDEWKDEAAQEVPVKIARAKPLETLSGKLLDACGFDVTMVLVKNRKGEAQALSFRTLAPLFLVSEEAVIGQESLVAPPSFGRTAARSAFSLVVSGRVPGPEEISRLQEAHQQHEHAEQQVAVIGPIIDSLRDEIAEAGFTRGDLERDIAEIDESLAGLSEQVAASGDAVRALLDRRNEALAAMQAAGERVTRAVEVHSRFDLLAQHYDSDVQRLEFAMESGHFFQQLAASHCPRCGRPLKDSEECHAESADFAAIERASRAELKKLGPRIADLQTAITDVRRDAELGRADQRRWKERAAALDFEIRQVANPTANEARQRVQALARRRSELDAHLLRFRELDRYLAVKQEADVAMQQSLDTFRPSYQAASLRSLQGHVKAVLESWRFPVRSDVVYDVGADDLVIDGKARAANGKGVRAVTHAAFTVGLMRHCFSAGTPHAGFVMIDTPLTPFRGASQDDEEDPQLRADVHAASLVSLASNADRGQSVIIENIDPPAGLEQTAGVVVFTGPGGPGRNGFYPTTNDATT